MLLLIVGCAENSPASTFDTAGPVSELQASLFYLVLFIAIGVFVVVEGLILFATFRYRRHNEGLPKQTHGNQRLEILWTIIPTIIIVIIAIPTVIGIWQLANPSDAGDELEVEAIGHQWWFEFRYPTEGVVTANELVVPTDRWVRLTLSSQDVIHSFWVPRLFGKRDMLPNHENTLWFRADEVGDYVGICAEFCGIAHAKMQFVVKAMAPDDYDAWRAGWFTPPSADLTESESAGASLFLQYCATCHSDNSYRTNGYEIEIAAQQQRWDAFTGDEENGSNLPGGSSVVSAPNLTGFGTRTTLGAGSVPLTDETLFDWIRNPAVNRNGDEVKPGTRMQGHAIIYTADWTDSQRAYYQNPTNADLSVETDANLTDAEINQLVDYLMSRTPAEVGG